MGKNCPWCGTKLENITYLELMRKKPLWALLPAGIILFLISLIWAGISRSVESVIFLFIMILLVFGGSYYAGRKKERQTLTMERKITKWKMLSYYGAGIFMEVIGIGIFLYFVLVAEVSLALLSAPTIIIGIILLAYAEHLRRKLKRTKE